MKEQFKEWDKLYRMPQSERNRRVTFRWEEITQAVPRIMDDKSV